MERLLAILAAIPIALMLAKTSEIDVIAEVTYDEQFKKTRIAEVVQHDEEHVIEANTEEIVAEDFVQVTEDVVIEEAFDDEKVEDTEPEEEIISEEFFEEIPEVTEESVNKQTRTEKKGDWHTGLLTAKKGYITDGPAGPNGNDGYETWYDLDMTRVVQIMDELMEKKGMEDGCVYDYEYWVREDGCKMYGPYIMVAGDIVNTRKRGDIVETSRGLAMVCDYCEYAVKWRPYQIDIATDWEHTYSMRD